MSTSSWSSRICRASISYSLPLFDAPRTYSRQRVSRLVHHQHRSHQLQQKRSISSNTPSAAASFPLASASSSSNVDDIATTTFETLSPLSAAVIAPTFFQPLSTLLLAFPPLVGLSYAVFIPLLSFSLRLATSYPIALWQRSRTRKFASVVVPEIKAAQEIARDQLRDQCRRAGKSYEEYERLFKARAIKDAAMIAAKHNCRPIVTMVVPPLLHMPILITMVLVLRDACARSVDSLSQFSPSDLDPSNADATASSSPYSDMALSHLQELATTSFLWCPSLALPDPNMALPLLAGLALLANVELGAKARAAVLRAVQAGEVDRALDAVQSSQVRLERRNVDAIRAWDLKRKREFSTSAIDWAAVESIAANRRAERMRAKQPSMQAMREKKGQQEVNVEAEDAPVDSKERTNRIITNALRLSSLVLIPIFAQAPAAVCAYLVASNVFTLAMTASFARQDAAIETERVEERRLRLESKRSEL